MMIKTSQIILVLGFVLFCFLQLQQKEQEVDNETQSVVDYAIATRNS